MVLLAASIYFTKKSSRLIKNFLFFETDFQYNIVIAILILRFFFYSFQH